MSYYNHGMSNSSLSVEITDGNPNEPPRANYHGSNDFIRELTHPDHASILRISTLSVSFSSADAIIKAHNQTIAR